MTDTDREAALRNLLANTPDNMPIARSVLEALSTAGPPTPDRYAEVINDLVPALIMSVVRLESRMVAMESRSEIAEQFLKAAAAIFPKPG